MQRKSQLTSPSTKRLSPLLNQRSVVMAVVVVLAVSMTGLVEFLFRG